MFMNWSSFYVQIAIGLAITLGGIVLTIVDILPLRVLVGLITIFILLAIWRNYLDRSLKSKRKITKDIFFNLNIPALKEALKYWGDSWDDVKKITLYPAPVDLPSVGGKTIKYILHWKCSNVHKVLRQTLLEGNWGCDKYLITDDQYKFIYKEVPSGEYRNEWHCVTKVPKGVDKRYSVLLYPMK